jgi:plastocyanin
MTRRTTLAGAGLAALTASAVAIAPATASHVKDNGAQIRIAGGTVFKAGHSVSDNQRFTGTTSVRPGQTIKVVNRAKSDEPHTVTFVKRSDLPRSFADMGKPIFEEFMKAHEVPQGPGGPDGPPPAPGKPVVNAGAEGFDMVGDSYFFQGKRYSIKVAASAKKGTYSYLCLIHPWMQGTVRVK